jgi:GntR family transcriptional regulator/MocR family aminotransferase
MWRAMQNKVWQKDGADALPEGDGAGWLPLRRELALHLHAMRGVACSPEQIIVVSSVQAAIDLTLRVLAEPGDGIWVEDPGYPQARAAFDYHRLRQHPVPVDHDGIRVDVGLARAADARLAYVTPACHFPLCTLLSQARREALLSWADAGDAYVIEDDWDFNAAFNGQFPVEPLAASASDRVIFIHSLNRILFPGLRITALVVPAKLTHRFVAARKAIDGFPNVANQMTLSRFMGEGMLSAHLRRCRAVYEERRSAMQQAVAEHLAPWLVIDDQTRGLHRVLQSRVEPDTELASRGRSAGVPCSALSDFAIEPLAGNGALVLGFGAFSPAAIAQAAQRLGLALERE